MPIAPAGFADARRVELLVHQLFDRVADSQPHRHLDAVRPNAGTSFSSPGFLVQCSRGNLYGRKTLCSLCLCGLYVRHVSLWLVREASEFR
jgi:hypothetical protein